MSGLRDKESNPTNVAVALKYQVEENAVPSVVAIGRGHVADNIIQAAQVHSVHIEHNAELAYALAKLDLEDAIPPTLYKAVATVIGFLIRCRQPR